MKGRQSLFKFSSNFNSWLSEIGNGESIPADFKVNQSDFSFIPPDFSIQQNEIEIMKFIDVLKKNNCKKIIEIGLGYYGSTHVLFRENFETVCTLEISIERVKAFYFRAEKFFGDKYFSSKNSAFVVANSNSSEGAEKLIKYLKTVNFQFFDALFIDGFHGYGTVLLDFLIYSNFVKRGGIIGFHDVNSSIENSGVAKLIKELKSYNFANINGSYREIIESEDLGIGYFIKE